MAIRDYLNLYLREELREYVFAHGQAIAIMGVEEIADQPIETWYFDENSMAVDNNTTVIRPNEILETDPGRYIINMVQADWNAMFNKPNLSTVALSGSYNDLEDKITAGAGIVMDGNEMSMDEAIQADIDSKVPATRTVTINGQTKDLSANRDWQVGNVSTDGSYVNPSWITSLDYSKLTGAPSIPTNNNQLTNGSGYITASSTDTLTNKSGNISQWTNNSGYLTSVPAQSFSSLTGKPTTLSGYGITDAYPLSGNPSNFLTGITSGQVTTALGLTPINTAGARTAISLTTTGSSGNSTYDNSTGVLNIPNYNAPSRTFNNNVSRTLNSNYTISSTKDANVNYSLSLSVTNPLLVGTSTASAFLEYSTDGGTNWTTVSQVVNSSSVGLTVTVAITLPNTMILSGNIPANALTRIRTTTSGTASVTFTRAQEMLY